MQIYTLSLLECKLPLLDAPPVGGERRRGVRGTPAEESAGGRGFRRLSPRAPPSARLAASSSPPCARGLDPAYSAPLAPLSAVAAASRALREPALLARGNHLPAHVLWKPQREPLEVAVEAHREGVARGVRPRDERRRPPRPRPHRAALAPDPLQLHRLLPPRLLLVLGALAGHVDGHLIRGLLLRGHLAGAARPRPRELLAGVEVAQGGRASPARAERGRT